MADAPVVQRDIGRVIHYRQKGTTINHCFTCVREDSDLEALLIKAKRLGFKPEYFYQESGMGSNGYLRLVRSKSDETAAITAFVPGEITGQPPVYRLYRPVVCGHKTDHGETHL